MPWKKYDGCPFKNLKIKKTYSTAEMQLPLGRRESTSWLTTPCRMLPRKDILTEYFGGKPLLLRHITKVYLVRTSALKVSFNRRVPFCKWSDYGRAAQKASQTEITAQKILEVKLVKDQVLKEIFPIWFPPFGPDPAWCCADQHVAGTGFLKWKLFICWM